MPPPATARALPEELVEEIFFRVPPTEPASLVRASLASKPWLSLLTGRRFNGRYCEFHGSPPMLGLLCHWRRYTAPTAEDNLPPFISTTSFAARIPDDEDWVASASVMDCRHGRVLLSETGTLPLQFIVWDPMTGSCSWLCAPEDYYNSEKAAVVCAVSGCNHRACHEGPFRIILVGVRNEGDGYGCVAYAHMSLPKLGQWSNTCHGLDLEGESAYILDKPSVLAEGALYFILVYHDDDDGDGDDDDDGDDYGGRDDDDDDDGDDDDGDDDGDDEDDGDDGDDDDDKDDDDDADGGGDDDDDDDDDDNNGNRVAILKYDLGSNYLSVIDAPPKETHQADDVILMLMEDGGLGFAQLDRLTLIIWSRQMGPDGFSTWTQRTVVNLKELLPIQNIKETLRLTGSVEGGDIIFVTTDLGIYQINIKSLQWKKVWKREEWRALFPYMSFYNPQERVGPRYVVH
ncbi:uncharacterized protein [Lolium perenne]|uniref:uncharacterized protein n=1 Tax=Lolium perenne TaxID=4522 RepID=UPI0021E9EA6C|nr:uncharacterized protein LOC127338940 [Lolium perenne]